MDGYFLIWVISISTTIINIWNGQRFTMMTRNLKLKSRCGMLFGYSFGWLMALCDVWPIVRVFRDRKCKTIIITNTILHNAHFTKHFQILTSNRILLKSWQNYNHLCICISFCIITVNTQSYFEREEQLNGRSI